MKLNRAKFKKLAQLNINRMLFLIAQYAIQKCLQKKKLPLKYSNFARLVRSINFTSFIAIVKFKN